MNMTAFSGSVLSTSTSAAFLASTAPAAGAAIFFVSVFTSNFFLLAATSLVVILYTEWRPLIQPFLRIQGRFLAEHLPSFFLCATHLALERRPNLRRPKMKYLAPAFRAAAWQSDTVK